MGNPRLTAAVRDCGFVLWHWTDLLDAKVPGTPRPWAQTMTREESRAKARTQAREVEVPQGPAPVHLDVVDTVVEVRRIGRELAVYALEAIGDDPAELPHGVGDDARPWWAYLARVLDRLVDQRDDGVDEVLRRIRHAKQLTAAALRLILDGHVIEADCPWCRARPLKVRIVAGEPLVVCESDRVCEPPEADCGNWIGRRGVARPAWIQPEWEWLAQRIRHAEAA